MEPIKEVPVEGLLLKWVDITISVQNKTYSVIYELDKTIGYVKGFQLTTNRDLLMRNRGTIKIEVNKQEVVPEGYEAKQLYTTENVAVNERMFIRGGRIDAGNGQIKFEYTDTNDSLYQFEPYKVRLNIDCIAKGY